MTQEDDELPASPLGQTRPWPCRLRAATALVAGGQVFALMVFGQGLAAFTHLTTVPVETIRLPWGQRYTELDRPPYQLVAAGQAP